MYDAVIIGGGFFGCTIARFLKQRYPRILVIERERGLFCRASFVNQARVHNGYHYPRSYTTAYRSRVNFPRFVAEYQTCIDNSFIKLYCIARYHSKVTGQQFKKFCTNIGAPCRPARPEFVKLFSPRLIEAVFEVEEVAFNAHCLREHAREQLASAQIDVWLGETVTQVTTENQQIIHIQLANGRCVTAQCLFNCTYSAINHLPGARAHPAAVKHEITEVGLVQVPNELKNIGITVMDGAFFSVMPFPSRGLHSLTHVRYTPHAAWFEHEGAHLHPYAILDTYPKISRMQYMLRDAQRYLPVLAHAQPVESLFEIKTVLINNETDDGRPILFDRLQNTQIFSVLGGKVDNIYDILKELS
ncbi:MAG: hypothetical protein BWK79_20020 [Beggiatoa sp. IS2]|nr:MAG: hypothetical protein BWK79_20020 [Beggiatoa sp. IS2]